MVQLTSRRARGLGAALALWILVAVAYDALILLVAAGAGDRPVEVPLLALCLLNPVDAARVGLVLAVDAPALMGYTGAIMRRALGQAGGIALTRSALVLWATIPLLAARRRFGRKDF